MASGFDKALAPINAMIGSLAPKLRGALVEELVDEIAREKPSAASRKALVLDNIVSEALREAPLPSRVRASPKLARCVATLPEATMTLACDVVQVAEAILSSAELTDEMLAQVCTADRQEHMRIIAKRPRVSMALADIIAKLGEIATVMVLVRNGGAQISPEGYAEIAERLGNDPAILALISGRADCPQDISRRVARPVSEILSGEALNDKLLELAASRQISDAMDLIMRAIGRDRDAGRKLLERDDEKALGAVCHVAGVDADVYEALVEAWRVITGRPLTDVHKAPVRYRLMRPAEIDRVVSRLPIARTRVGPIAMPA
ncbi:DUF2336 domain-containing protein [Phreatobacter sp.]|uniref:DUF2336 domain-containing protein n=1 Tax=Phreatobacter sp. TaxID=1966341 RepID=UPI003F6F7B6A